MAIFAHNYVKLPRKLLTLIAMISEPGNIDVYFDIKNEGFNSRCATTYLKEMKMVLHWASRIITIRNTYLMFSCLILS
ncbi:MAG TPA: hypothetical protein VHG34_01500 [Nitrososphaeraceae archaeon]|nr:hypothetical protein [Nitrososphaeraceae archaeon]